MSRKRDLTGAKFGRLTVLSEAGRTISGGRRWLCRCECGTEKTIASTALVSSLTRSCGCLQREKSRERASDQMGIKNANFKRGNALLSEFQRQKRHAETKRELSWTLSYLEFIPLIKGNCAYCGDGPEMDAHGLVRNGIDRVDNSSGYSNFNCVTCCKTCNFIKRNMSFDEFKAKICKIASNFASIESKRA